MAAITSRRVRVLPQRPGPPPDGVSVVIRRASDVGVGFLSLTFRGVQAVFDQFLPGAVPADSHNLSMARQIARAATGVALVAESQALAVGEILERTSQRAVGTARQVPLVRDVLVGIDSSVTRWAERGDAELERRQRLVTDFAGRVLPALAEAALERVDFAAIAARVPVIEIVAAIDLDAILEHVDVNAILEHVDVNAILERVDLEALLARIDADALVGRVDADGLIRRVDVEALLHRIDLGPIVAEVLTEVDVGGIVRESTGSITSDAVDGARLTAMRLDGFVARVADRILLRGPGDRNADPDR